MKKKQKRTHIHKELERDTILCWHWSVADLPSDTLLDKTDILFPRRDESQTGSWLRLWLCINFSISVTGYLSGLNLCRHCVYCHNLYEFMYVLVLLCLDIFLSHPSPLVLIIFLLP